MNGIADTWDQQTPPFAPSINTALLSCDWARISGIEIALVARGSIDNTGSSGSPPITWATLAGTWTGAAVGQVNLGSIPNWSNYHYKLFQTTVPLRNINIQAIPALASTGASC